MLVRQFEGPENDHCLEYDNLVALPSPPPPSALTQHVAHPVLVPVDDEGLGVVGRHDDQRLLGVSHGDGRGDRLLELQRLLQRGPVLVQVVGLVDEAAWGEGGGV